MNSQVLFINSPLLPPDERLDVEEDIIRVKATFEEYLLFSLKEEPKKVEYSNGYITYMSFPTDTHELIIGKVQWVFNTLLFDEPNYLVYPSNLGVLCQATGNSYKPDATILAEAPVFVFHKVGTKRLKHVVNPFAIFEVFSDGTMDYDINEKLPNYKTIPSLRYIIYIHQHKPLVTVYSRKNAFDKWTSQEFEGLNASFPFEGKMVPLWKIYHQVIFLGKG